MNIFEMSPEDLVLSSLALLALSFVVYLLRLEFTQIRKNHRMAEKGLQFGLVQTLTGSHRPLATKKPLSTLTLTAPVTAIVSDVDTGSKRWTTPVETGVLTYRWN